MENDLDTMQRNVIVNAYEARHAGSIEEGSEGEEEKRKKVADDLGEFSKKEKKKSVVWGTEHVIL